MAGWGSAARGRFRTVELLRRTAAGGGAAKVIKRTLWSGQFVTAIAVNLFIAVVFYLLLTSMAGYAIEMFAASETMAGFVASSFVLGSVAGRLVIGKYLDFLGRRRVVVGSAAVFLVASVAYFVPAGLGVLLAIRLVHGVAFGVGSTALAASVQSIIPRERRAEGNGFFAMSMTVGTAIGPFLAVWLSQSFGYVTLFAVGTACAAAAFVAGCLYRVPERRLTEQERGQRWSLTLSSFVDAEGLRIGAVLLLSGIAYMAIVAFIAVYTQQLGIGESSTLFFVLYALTSFVSRLFVGRIQDAFGANVVVYPVFACFTAGMLVVAFAASGAMIVLAGALVGLGFGSLLPTLQAMLINRVPAERVGVATSTFFLCLDFGAGIGPVVLGAAATLVDYRAMYLIGAALTVVAAVIYTLMYGSGRRRGAA